MWEPITAEDQLLRLKYERWLRVAQGIDPFEIKTNQTTLGLMDIIGEKGKGNID